MNVKHIEDSLAKVRPIYERASARIEALKIGEKIPATKLAEELAAEFGTTGPALYPTLKFLLTGYPGVSVTRGAHGGITKLAPVVDVPATDVAPVTDAPVVE